MSANSIATKQSQALSSPGVSGDLVRAEYAFGAEGWGFARKYVTTGSNLDVPVLQDIDFIIPRFTIVNQGTSNIRFGFRSTGGSSGVLLGAGASYTFVRKNPAKNNLVVNDLGTSGIEIDFIS